MIFDGSERKHALPAVNFSRKKSLLCEGLFTALPCLTKLFVPCIAIDLDLFVIIQMLLFIVLFAECPALQVSRGSRG